jgi:hypothetical protein
MLHRHLNHQEYTLAAIDDVIDRGKPEDWTELRAAALNDRTIMEKIFRVAVAHSDDPYSPEVYLLWRKFAEQNLRNVDGAQ